MTKKSRPTLTDPVEFALIKSIYFNDDRPIDEGVDLIEKLERSESRTRYSNKSSR